MNELSVMPACESPTRLVTTVTPVANAPTTSRKSSRAWSCDIAATIREPHPPRKRGALSPVFTLRDAIPG